jgi:hypothetical protein
MTRIPALQPFFVDKFIGLMYVSSSMKKKVSHIDQIKQPDRDFITLFAVSIASYSIACECEEVKMSTFKFQVQSEFIREALDEGWYVNTKGNTVCPDCRRRKKK